MPYVYEIELVKAVSRIAAELPELTKALHQLAEELRAVRKALEEAKPKKT